MPKEVQGNKIITQTLVAEPVLTNIQAIIKELNFLSPSHVLTTCFTDSQLFLVNKGRELTSEHLQCVLHVSTFSQQPCKKCITPHHK